MTGRRSNVVLSLLATGVTLATTACGGGGKSGSGGASTAPATTAPTTTKATTAPVTSSKPTTAPTSSSSTPTKPAPTQPVTPQPGPVIAPSPVAPVSSSAPTAPVTSSAPAQAVVMGSNASPFLYVASSNDKISTVALDPVTGAPSNPVDTDLGTGGSFYPAAVAIADSGSTVLVAGSTSIMALSANVGVLAVPAATSTTNPFTTTFSGATGLAVLPGSSFVLSADGNAYGGGAGGLDGYTWQNAANGTVFEAAGSLPIGTYGGPSSLAIDPTGAWVYFANNYDQNVQVASVTTSSATVTFGTASAPAADPSWSTNYTSPLCCVLLTQSNGQVFLTGNSDGTISAFPVVTPGTLGTVSTVYTPPAALVNGNGCYVSGIAVDSKAQFVVISDQFANQLFAFSAVVANGTVTLTPTTNPASSVVANAASVCFNADGPVCYAVDNQSSNGAASNVYAFSIDATGLTLVGAAVPLTDVNDQPYALTAGR